MKHIDSEKLIAYIERRKEKYRNTFLIQNPIKVAELDDLLNVISSLQQDHLADASKMVESEHIADVSKMIEQPGVKLEKEIEKYFSKWLQGASDEGCFNPDSQLVSIYDCHRIARHFYKLGLNARKEE